VNLDRAQLDLAARAALVGVSPLAVMSSDDPAILATLVELVEAAERLRLGWMERQAVLIRNEIADMLKGASSG